MIDVREELIALNENAALLKFSINKIIILEKCRVMSRIGGKMNNRTFVKERQINNTFIDFFNKQRIIVSLILDMYENAE